MANELVKIVFWDLDGTFWSGTLEEDSEEATRPLAEAKLLLIELDNRGILNAIISQASAAAAEKRLHEHGLLEYFIHPQYEVGSKAQAVAAALQELNLLPCNAVFIDDLQFHRAEVAALLPDVTTASPEDIPRLLADSRFAGSGGLGVERRQLYQAEERRNAALGEFAGNRHAFLQACKMELSCSLVSEQDKPRFHELLVRAHRLSSLPAGVNAVTDGDIKAHGLAARSSVHRASDYAAHLCDRFGNYGLVAGARLSPRIEQASQRQQVICEQLAVSCRVQGRGVLEAFLWWLAHDVVQHQEFLIPVNLESEVNRPLRMALRICGFAPVQHQENNNEVLALVSPNRLQVPEWMHLSTAHY